MSTETKSQRGAATRDQILDAAARLIHLQGYHCTSLDDVLRESGVGKGNFYYYFKSKEDLCYAIIDRVSEHFVATSLGPAFADPTGDVLAQISAFLDSALEAQRQRNCVGGCPLGNLASELSDVHEGFRQRLAEVFLRWRAGLASALARAQARGQISPAAEPDALAEFLVAGLEGAILLAKVTRDVLVLDRCVAELKRHLVAHTLTGTAVAPGPGA